MTISNYGTDFLILAGKGPKRVQTRVKWLAKDVMKGVVQ